MTTGSEQPRLLDHDVAVTLAVAGLSYLRWTQLVPMLLAWGFLLLMVGALLLVNFQDQAFGLLERGAMVYLDVTGEDPETLFGPDPDAGATAARQESMPDLAAPPAAENPGTAVPAPETAAPDAAPAGGGVDFESWIWWGWGLLSLAGWLLGGLWTLVFGPREPWPLSRKLIVVALLAAACSGGMLFSWAFGSEQFNGSPGGWIALFVGLPVGVWLVSAWSLGLSHALGIVIGAIQGHAAAPER